MDQKNSHAPPWLGFDTVGARMPKYGIYTIWGALRKNIKSKFFHLAQEATFAIFGATEFNLGLK